MKKQIILILFIALMGTCISCEKLLDEKPDGKLAVPETLDDLEAILGNTALMNNTRLGLGEASADNYSLTTELWNGLGTGDKQIYVWGDDIAPEAESLSSTWFMCYRAIYYANTVLEVLASRKDSQDARIDFIKGKALFTRAFYYLVLTTTWCPAYDDASADKPVGIPLRLDSDFNVPSQRATLRQCYLRIEEDIKMASDLLPTAVNSPVSPIKAAAFALLSRMYLAMGDYEQALSAAESCLVLKNMLMDYNNSEDATYPFPYDNPEVLFSSWGCVGVLAYGIAYGVDTTLYQSYANLDQRKALFFKLNADATIRFRGSYFGGSNPFTGLAIDEVMLNKAECLIRAGENVKGIETLNELLRNRYDKNYQLPQASLDKQDLNVVLAERRKELIFRDIRWMDLKRLNKEKGLETILTRKIGDETFELLPNSERYIMPLPENVLNNTDMVNF